jgi:hypothetical protein
VRVDTANRLCYRGLVRPPGSGLGAATFHRGCLSGTRTAPALAEQRTASAPCFAERVRLFLDTTVAKSRSCNYGAGAMPIMFGG